MNAFCEKREEELATCWEKTVLVPGEGRTVVAGDRVTVAMHRWWSSYMRKGHCLC